MTMTPCPRCGRETVVAGCICPPTPRTYVVGVPLVIQIGTDGAVTFEVDLCEASEGIHDDEDATQRFLVAQREADEKIVSAATATLGNYFQFSTGAPRANNPTA